MSMPVPSRREFLQSAVAAGVAGAVLPAFAATSAKPLGTAKSCIFINLVGGPSQLDTFDPKPTAKADDRGPFRPIRTRVPGMLLSELFPKMAAMADKFTLLRGMHHTAPPVHEAGFQLLNTGRLFRDGPVWPNVGAVVANLYGVRNETLAWCKLPGDDIDTGIRVSHGQDHGFLPTRDPWELLPRFVGSSFQSACYLAESAVGDGARFVTVNQFTTVFDKPSWDCHADRGSLNTTLNDYRDTVAPMFDTAFSALLTDLETRGLLDSTLVVATGEFGRTPWLNCNGGRDHWANAWTAIVAGGGVQGGRVIGATDRGGAEVVDRPTTPQELVATIFHAMGVPANATIPGPDGSPMAVYPGSPIADLF